MKKIIIAILILLIIGGGSYFFYQKNIGKNKPVNDPAGSGASLESLFYEDFGRKMQGLVDAKNPQEFLNEYRKNDAYIENLITKGSGSIFYTKAQIDKIIPFLYICKMTESGDEKTFRTLLKKDGSIFPHKTSTMDVEMAQILDKSESITSDFLDSRSTLREFYKAYADVFGGKMPKYFKDLLTDRMSAIGKNSGENDCENRLGQYGWFAH